MISRKPEPNEAVQVTAARVRMLLNLKGRVLAAARDSGVKLLNSSQLCFPTTLPLKMLP